MSQTNNPLTLMTLSTASNRLTCVLPKKPSLTPAERAIERFSVTGNAIVTGGAGGLGLESARALLEHGVKGLCIFDLASVLASETAGAAIQALHEEFPQAKITEEAVDVADEESIERGVAKTVGVLGSVHVLLCFAGIARGGKATEMAVEEWKKVQDVNTTGSWLCARIVAREMIKQGEGGSIVFTSSIAAHKVLFPFHQAAYGVSKAGLLQLTSSLAAEWAQYGIQVNSISPGFMDTAMTQGDGLRPGREVWEKRNPMGRMGDAGELTGPIVMLCSPGGRYITGIDILVDGGGHVF